MATKQDKAAAAAAAKKDDDTAPTVKDGEVLMEKDGQRTEVADNGSVEAMEAAGWTRVVDKA